MSWFSWSSVRAFVGRFAIALVVAATATTAAVASVNHEIDTRREDQAHSTADRAGAACGGELPHHRERHARLRGRRGVQRQLRRSHGRDGEELRHFDGRARRAGLAAHDRRVVSSGPRRERPRSRRSAEDQRRVRHRRPAGSDRHARGQFRHSDPPLRRGGLQDLPGRGGSDRTHLPLLPGRAEGREHRMEDPVAGLRPAQRGRGARVRAQPEPPVPHRRRLGVRRPGRARPPPHRASAGLHPATREPRDLAQSGRSVRRPRHRRPRARRHQGRRRTPARRRERARAGVPDRRRERSQRGAVPDHPHDARPLGAAVETRAQRRRGRR